MDKIVWHYDKHTKMWWCNETVPYANDGWDITKMKDVYELRRDYRRIGAFKKLSSAKQVANLLKNG